MPRSKPSIILLVALILAGCGSPGGGTASNSTSTGSQATSTASPVKNGGPGAGGDRSAYIAAADRLCKSANTRQEALRHRATGLAVAKLPPILRQQATIAGGLATSLGKLTPPAGDRAAVNRFLGAVHQLSVYSTAVANSIAAGHGFAAKALAAKLRLGRQQEALLGQGYGYRICASGKSY